MAEDITFTLGWTDIDCGLLPSGDLDPGTEGYRRGVTEYLQKQYESSGAKVRIVFDDAARSMTVTLTDAASFGDIERRALEAMKRGDERTAVPLLMGLIAKHPNDPKHLYNLGMLYSGSPDSAAHYLEKALRIDPTYTNAIVALGVVYARAGKLDEAIDALARAVALEPHDHLAHQNLGGCLLKQGDCEQAEEHFRISLKVEPTNIQSQLGLGQTLESQERYPEADQIYQAIIKTAGHTDVGNLAKEGRTRIAHALLRRAGDERPDVVMYCLGALERFENLSPQEIGGIGREIAILGMKGLDINDPSTKYTLQSLSGEFSGLHLVSIMYAAFAQTSPGTDVGIDLSNEYAQALKMFKER
jgi:tetratricopeptide (TPR) repeat protein